MEAKARMSARPRPLRRRTSPTRLLPRKRLFRRGRLWARKSAHARSPLLKRRQMEALSKNQQAVQKLQETKTSPTGVSYEPKSALPAACSVDFQFFVFSTIFFCLFFFLFLFSKLFCFIVVI